LLVVVRVLVAVEAGRKPMFLFGILVGRAVDGLVDQRVPLRQPAEKLGHSHVEVEVWPGYGDAMFLLSASDDRSTSPLFVCARWLARSLGWFRLVPVAVRDDGNGRTGRGSALVGLVGTTNGWGRDL
jgi:hypothetical protein